jgi:nicotinamidase/pyrazinamidase
MRKALIVVDVQNDFLPGGALAVPRGDEVIEPICKLIHSQEYALIILTQDWHPPETSHFDHWPIHCVAGTKGAEIAHDVESEFTQVVGDEVRGFRAIKGVYRDQDGYSGFEGYGRGGFEDYPDLSVDDVLEDERIEEIDIVGLALDFCVRATALDAVQGYKTRVLLGATRSVDGITGEAAVEEMEEAGVEVVNE